MKGFDLNGLNREMNKIPKSKTLKGIRHMYALGLPLLKKYNAPRAFVNEYKRVFAYALKEAKAREQKKNSKQHPRSTVFSDAAKKKTEGQFKTKKHKTAEPATTPVTA